MKPASVTTWGRGGGEKTNWNMAEVISLKRALCGLRAKSAEIYAEGAAGGKMREEYGGRIYEKKYSEKRKMYM